MRYNFSPSLWILVYVIFVWLYKRFNCNDYCERPDLYNYEIVIIENDTYRYSIHYKYSMRIQRNQSQPVPSEHFISKIYDKYDILPGFSFSYYGSHVRRIQSYHDAELVYDVGYSHIGNIYNYVVNYNNLETYVIRGKVTATMTSLIQPNGKVSFYYDNIPTEIEEYKVRSKIRGLINCEGGRKKHEISVPAKWIKSGSLVVFEAIREICSQYNTNETCQNAEISILTCFWCEKKEKCIISNLQDTHDCRVEKNSNVNDLNISTTMEHSKTTSGITEVQNRTTRTTEENKQHKSHWYLYVVIPLVASLFLICIGCIIWRWLLRRKRSNE
uniref:Egg protein CP391S-like protein n=1 Tax=Schistosoma mansoni TaxID=6183 RepID=A0AA82N828_SCHMA